MATEADLRRAAMACADTVELPHFGVPSWRIGGRIFAQLSRDPGRAILKLPRGVQEALFQTQQEIFAPCVWGKLVWCFVRLDAIGADQLGELTSAAWRATAPATLTA